MKLKPDFISQDIDGVRFLVPVGEESFKGVIKGNKTAAFIVDRLTEETTEEEIVAAMCEKYDAPRETISADVKAIVEKLREIGALTE